jgi:hypothetical protein
MESWAKSSVADGGIVENNIHLCKNFDTMASTLDFIQFVIDQINTEAELTYKKMFGEYMIYADGKPVITVCNDKAFVKDLDCVRPLLEGTEKGCPYAGAKEHYLVDVDNGSLLSAVVKILEQNVPLPKKKRKT